MTKHRHLKRRIRERMQKTGESYTAARLHILRGRHVDTVAASATAEASAARAGLSNPRVQIRLPRVRPRVVTPSRLTYAVPFYVILLFILVALSGCAGDSAEPTVMVRDSAAIRIVENLPAGLGAAYVWTLSDDPVLEVGGGVNPAAPLYQVTDAVPLDGDRVAIAQNTPPQVHVFDDSGTLTATLGRKGSGPGEFMSVGSIVALGTDSVAVWDPDRRRISIFEASGGFVRELDVSRAAPLSTRAAPATNVSSGFTQLLASGASAFVIFGEGAVDPDGAPGIGRPPLPSVRISMMGDVLAQFDPIPGMEMVHGGPAGTLPLPFGARTDAAAAGDMLVVGTAEHTQVRIYTRDGTLQRIVRWPDHDRAVAGPWLEEWTAMVDAVPPPMRELIEASPRRDRFPAYDGIVTSDEGEVLVGEYAGPIGIWPLRRADEGPEALRPVRRTRARRWLVFDSAGVLSATIRTPEGFAPTAVHNDRMWGLFTDTLDIESVRAYRIIR